MNIKKNLQRFIPVLPPSSTWHVAATKKVISFLTEHGAATRRRFFCKIKTLRIDEIRREMFPAVIML
jgi:hypothetical protein